MARATANDPPLFGPGAVCAQAIRIKALMKHSTTALAGLLRPLIVLAAGMLVSAGSAFAAPTDPSSVIPPFDLNDKKNIDAGRVQFAQTCVYCHGYEASGGKAAPLKGRTDLTQDYLYATISNGKRAGSLVMPAWKESLDDDAIWTVVAYILSLQARPGQGSP
jgi:mono/diheme cytochrome c family protein